MNKLLQAFLDLFKYWDRGELGNFPDPAPPADLGSAMTQDDVDFVKSLRKEMTERFNTAVCTAEKTGVSITNTLRTNFTVSYTNPAGYTGTAVRYRVSGSSSWLVPNAAGNATGNFNGTSDAFSFTSGFAAATIYEIQVRNACANGILSSGVVVSATAT